MIDLLPGSGKTSKREEEETKERGNVGQCKKAVVKIWANIANFAI